MAPADEDDRRTGSPSSQVSGRAPSAEAAPARHPALAGLCGPALVVDTATMTIVDCNLAAAEILGREPGALRGKGMEVLRGVQSRGPDLAVVVLTSSGTPGSALAPPAAPEAEPAGTRAPARRRASPVLVAEDSLRGSPGGGEPVLMQAGPLALDRETNLAVVAAGPGERRASLTPSEARLLALLMGRPGRVWSCRDLARLALGYDVLECEAVEIVRPHVSRLRQKLEPDPLRPRLIRTVRGQGYRLSP